MKKSILGFLVLMCSIFVSIPALAQAEQYPQNFIQVNFTETTAWGKYYVTILSETHYGGGNYAWDGTDRTARYREGDADYEIWKAFAEYKDVDGYFFLQKFEECSTTNQYIDNCMGLNFKVLIYFPESGNFFCTELLQKYDTASYFEIDLSDGTVSHEKTREDVVKENLESIKVGTKVAKAIPGLLILLGAARKAMSRKKQNSAKSKIGKLSKNPDSPRMLGYKTGWLAIKSNSPEEVMKKLGMKHPKVANWETGMANRNSLRHFVTPVMDGYVIISDVLENYAENPEKLDEIAKMFEEVLFFGTHRTIDLYTWVKYERGKRVRRYYYLGESGEVVSEGELTIEEYRLGFKEFPVSEDVDWDLEETMLPDEESVIHISKAWGVDPLFEAHRGELSTGYLVENF